MPVLIPAEVDLTLDLYACVIVTVMVGLVLFVGWVTRTAAVVWVSIFLQVLATVTLGAWMAYRLDQKSGLLTLETTVLRLVAGVVVALFIISLWALAKLPPIPWSQRHQDSVAEEPAEQYDKAWLLSLLQRHAAGQKVNLAKPPAPNHDQTPGTPPE